MTVTFQHLPVPGSIDPFDDFNPADPSHYPVGAGVYIYGLKLKIDGEEKFVPHCVGQGQNIGERLITHYISLKTGGNNRKELFNWYGVSTLADAKNVYTCMENYIESDTLRNPMLPNLIWYNDARFFNNKLELIPPNISTYISNSGQQASIGNGNDLDTIAAGIGHHPNCADVLKDEIVETKELFDECFYFIYATDVNLDQNGDFLFDIPSNLPLSKRNREHMENTVKRKLHKINIYTTAKANKATVPVAVDLSVVQEVLINLDHLGCGFPIYKPNLFL
jgi:hypothetical protein